jgi:hypothetical protein
MVSEKDKIKGKNMNINHSPILDTKRVCELYSQKDGVPVSYVCTSAPNLNATYAVDIFYRETPHPEHGNRYFGLYLNLHFASDGTVMIANADPIEDLEFAMIEGPEGWEYSQHRHDYRTVGDCAIDGGRAYVKRVGDLSVPCKYMTVKDGEFVEQKHD